MKPQQDRTSIPALERETFAMALDRRSDHRAPQGAGLLGCLRRFFSQPEQLEVSEADYLHHLLACRGNDLHQPPPAPELMLVGGGHYYHETLTRLLQLGAEPLPLKEVLKHRLAALKAVGESALHYGRPLRDLWGIQLATCDMALLYRGALKLMDGEDFIKRFMRENTESSRPKEELRICRGDYVVSARVFTELPEEELAFDNSHYCYSLSKDEALARKIWGRLGGNLFEEYAQSVHTAYGALDMEVWISVNWAERENRDLAILRPWHVGPMAAGSHLECNRPVHEFPCMEPIYFVGQLKQD